MKISLEWSDFKNQITLGTLPYRYIDINDIYYIYAADGPFEYECLVHKNNTSEQIDFEANYKNNASSTFSQFDNDGASIVRIKAAKKGWSFWAIPIEITTSTLGGSLFCKDSLGTNIPGITCRIYNDINTEILTEELLDLQTCVKTVIDFEPSFDYEVIGGSLRINSNPAEDIRLWIVGAPDIPAGLGGSKEFASGVNLKFMAPDASFDVDGRVTKYIRHDSTYHSGKLRLIIKHPPGSTVNMQFVLQVYRL